MKKKDRNLCKAVAANDCESALREIQAGANPNCCDATAKVTPLMMAARLNSVAMIHLLLEQGADYEAVDFIGRTAIDFAKKYKAMKAYNTLLREIICREYDQENEK